MKKKILVPIVILILVLGFIAKYRSLNTSLEETNKKIIENELNKDSEGRGYSDLGKEKLEYYSEIYKPYLSKEDYESFKIFYVLIMKYERKISLSKNKETFLLNYSTNEKIYKCFSKILSKTYKNIDIFDESKNVFSDKEFNGESSKTDSYSEIRFLRFEPDLKKRFDIINPEVTPSDCENFKNETNN